MDKRDEALDAAFGKLISGFGSNPPQELASVVEGVELLRLQRDGAVRWINAWCTGNKDAEMVKVYSELVNRDLVVHYLAQKLAGSGTQIIGMMAETLSRGLRGEQVDDHLDHDEHLEQLTQLWIAEAEREIEAEATSVDQ